MLPPDSYTSPCESCLVLIQDISRVQFVKVQTNGLHVCKYVFRSYTVKSIVSRTNLGRQAKPLCFLWLIRLSTSSSQYRMQKRKYHVMQALVGFRMNPS